MSEDNDLKAVRTVSQMAKTLGLSRARFYQLQNIGIFPKPVYNIYTKRPFYPLDLQQKCIKTRKTGVGLNGRPVIFNAPSKNNKNNRCNSYSDSKFDYFCDELVELLKKFKLKLKRAEIKTALRQIYRNGLEQYTVNRELIDNLLKHFEKQL